MTIFEKFQPLAEARQQLKQHASEFFNIVMEEILSGTEAVVNGRRTILAGSNNYLGLSFNSDCIDAACQAARAEGTGTTGSRMANGTFSGHVALEKELAEYFSLRAGRYRIIYKINDTDKVIEIHYVGHRKDVYQLFKKPNL